MRITGIEDLHASGGRKTISFLKITTDEGVTGWSEFSEFIGSKGLTALIREIAPGLIGEDPRATGRLSAMFKAKSRVASGGLNALAYAAIENACIDIKAKALGVPVYELLGGAIRDRLRVYWSHCGTYRISKPELYGSDPVRSAADFAALGREVVDRGVGALKTNIVIFDAPKPFVYFGGFGVGPGHPERDLPQTVLTAAIDQLSALREGAGPDTAIMLDILSNFRPSDCIKLARALEPVDLAWLELDLPDPDAVCDIRRSVRTPIASLETCYHREMYRPFLEKRAVDVAIIDVMWNGIYESVKIADLADAYDIGVSSHAFTSHLALMMSAHMCAAIPNYRYVEMDFDQPQWNDELFHTRPVVENGHLLVPDGPGWGIEVNEDAVRANTPGN